MSSPKDGQTGPDGSAFGGPAGQAGRGDTRLAFVWIPEGEYAAALARWPHLAEPGGAAAGEDGRAVSHRQYCRRLDAHATNYAAAAAAQGGRVDIVLAPLTIAAFAAWCAERVEDEHDANARAGWAAEAAHAGGADLIGWPPASRGECWCGSGRRYKSCCRTER